MLEFNVIVKSIKVSKNHNLRVKVIATTLMLKTEVKLNINWFTVNGSNHEHLTNCVRVIRKCEMKKDSNFGKSVSCTSKESSKILGKSNLKALNKWLI
jgi:hypothetical protein